VLFPAPLHPNMAHIWPEANSKLKGLLSAMLL